MDQETSRHTKVRRRLLIGFVASTALSLCLASLTLVPNVMWPSDPNMSIVATGVLVVTAASCLTSVTTFAGFVSMTVLMWRRDRRETQTADLERERQALEVERARLELGEAQGAGGAAEEGAEGPGSELASLRRQLAKAEESLRLIEEREAEFVVGTSVPLDLVKEKRQKQRRIEDLRQRIAELELDSG